MRGKSRPGLAGDARLRRRLLMPALVVGAVAAGLAATAPGTPSAAHRAPVAQSRPNVLVIETDDQHAQSLKFMPNVNSLIVDKGALFRNSFTNHSLCCPSRATFLTGEYEHNHGVRTNTPPGGGFQRFQALHGDNNLATWMQDAGYHTALIGKYLNGYSGDPRCPPGWNESFGAAPPMTQDVYDYTLNQNGDPESTTAPM